MAQRLSLAILALILVAAACGSPGPSPSPAVASAAPTASAAATSTPLASPAATATSEALPLGAWVAKKPDNMGFGVPSNGTLTLVVGPTTRVLLSGPGFDVGNPRNNVAYESSTTVVTDHQVRLVTTSVAGGYIGSGNPVLIDNRELAGCKLGDVGLYTWSLSAEGALLALASDGDACPSREAVLARAWDAHQIPFGQWSAAPVFRPTGGIHARDRMVLDLGESAVVRLPLTAPESGWFDSTVTHLGDYWEFTSIAGYGPRTGAHMDDAYAAGDDVPAECDLGDVGRYVSSLSADGSELTLASAGDACPSREAVLARTWGYRAPP